jgi:hypothetical protein
VETKADQDEAVQGEEDEQAFAEVVDAFEQMENCLTISCRIHLTMNDELLQQFGYGSCNYTLERA